MWPPPHHYTYALSGLVDQSPDLTVLARDGQVLCHKPVLACHSNFLKDVLLHSDTDVLTLPDFGKEEITNLIQVLYGQVGETLVSKELLKMLGIDVQKMIINADKGFILASLDEIVDSDLGEVRENEDFPMAEFQLSINEKKSIFDIDEFEEENSYKCCNCSSILRSLSILCVHMETCIQTEDQEIIYQCSVCSLIFSSLEDLGSHMDIHSNETPVNQEVILGDIEEAVLNADFVIADESMEEETNAQEAINEEIREEIILEEIEDNNHLVLDEEVEVQDPSIETTEVTVGCDDAMENDINSQKIDVSYKDLTGIKDISSMGISEKTVSRKNSSDIKVDINMSTTKDFSHTSLDKTVRNSTQENSNDLDMYKNPSEIKKVESDSLYSCELCSKAFSTEAILLLHSQGAHKKMNTNQNNQNNLDLMKKSDLNEKPISSDISTESSLLNHTQSSHNKIKVGPMNLDLSAKSDRNEQSTSSTCSTELSLLSHSESGHHKINVDPISLDLLTKSDQKEQPTRSDFSTESTLRIHSRSGHKINVDPLSPDLSTKSDQKEQPTRSHFSTESSLLSHSQSGHHKINVDPLSLHLPTKADRNEESIISDFSIESISQNHTESEYTKMNLDQMNLDLVLKSDENKRSSSSDLSSMPFLENTNHTQKNTHHKITVDETNFTEPDQNEMQNRAEFVCHFCHHRFNSTYSLNEHTVTFHTELLENGEMVNEDDILTKAIEMTDFAKIDEQVANQEASFIFSCTLCEGSFSSPKALTLHVNSNHVIQPPNHMPVSCNYCDIHFITRSTLAKHYETAHPGQQPIFQCPQCGKALKTFKSLQRHEVRHTDVRPFQCGQCRAKFHWGEDLRTHVKRGCKPNFSLPPPSQNASMLIPSQSFSPSQIGRLPIPSQSSNLSAPSQIGRQPIPSQCSSLPIQSSQFSLSIPSQSTNLPIPNSNPVVSISFDSDTNSINMSCSNCFLKFGCHEDYNSHICANQTQTRRSNTEEIFIPAPTEQSLPPDGQKNFWNNPLSEFVRQLSDHQEEHSNGGLESFEKIVHLNSTVNEGENEAVARKTPNMIRLKAPVKSNSMVEGCLPHKYNCNNCQYNTNIRKSFKKHLDSQKHKENSSVKRYFCDQCDMAFGTLKFLDDHVNRKHKIKKMKQRLLKLKEDKRTKLEIEATKFEEIHDENEISRELISKSGRKITPRMFADGDKVFTPLLNCLRKRTTPINESSNIESDCNTTLEDIDMTNDNEAEELAKKADTKKTDIDVIATQCELCQDFFVSRRSFFLHMLTHVPAGIRSNLPEGHHGWCPYCPGPVPLEEINSHVADCHPEILASSQDEEFGEIPCDADLEKILEDGFDLDEISQDELDMLDINVDPVVSTQCQPAFVKLDPVDLDRYGINVMDYM